MVDHVAGRIAEHEPDVRGAAARVHGVPRRADVEATAEGVRVLTRVLTADAALQRRRLARRQDECAHVDLTTFRVAVPGWQSANQGRLTTDASGHQRIVPLGHLHGCCGAGREPPGRSEPIRVPLGVHHTSGTVGGGPTDRVIDQSDLTGGTHPNQPVGAVAKHAGCLVDGIGRRLPGDPGDLCFRCRRWSRRGHRRRCCHNRRGRRRRCGARCVTRFRTPATTGCGDNDEHCDQRAPNAHETPPSPTVVYAHSMVDGRGVRHFRFTTAGRHVGTQPGAIDDT